MSPSEREHLRNQLALIRRQERRDPVENAFFALSCLTQQGRKLLEERWNAVFGQTNRTDSCTISFTSKEDPK